MPSLINIKTDLTKLRSQPKPFNTQIFSYSSNLTELKTNLTQLKFGSDQPGYGSSGLPYIQTTIPPVPNLLNAKGPGFPLYTPGTPASNPDYPIRGGAVEFQIGQQTYTLASQIDKTRIRRFFEDKQRGPLFIQKQVGLQLTNPKMEVGNTLFGIGQGVPIPGLLEITRVYNRGENTLAQVGVQGTGAHAVRHGLVPFNLFQKNYYAIVNAQNVNNEGMTNRLLNLNALKMTSSTSPFVNPQNVLDINTVNNLGISLNRNILFQYLGGPGSAYGIGNTTINRAVNTAKLGVSEKANLSKNVMKYDMIKMQNVNNITEGKATTNIQDFRSWMVNDADFSDPSTQKIFAGTWETERTVDYRFYVRDGVSKKDRINSSYPFIFRSNTNPWDVENQETDDLIKFVFEAVSNDDTNFSTAIFFRAFLTNGITDNHSAQWNNFKYLGRGENFYTYQGFDRSISFAFRIAAESGKELKPMYNRLNNLISQVYPDYSLQNNIMRAPIIRLTVGDYFYRMPGFLESVNVSVDNGTPWEINYTNLQNGNIAQLPHVVDVSVSFKAIPNQLQRRSQIQFQNVGNSDVSTTTGLAVQWQSVSAQVPEIIANNGKIINSTINSDLQRSTFRQATDQEMAEVQNKRLEAFKNSIKPNYSMPANFVKNYKAAELAQAKFEQEYYGDVKTKQEFFPEDE